MVRSNLDSTINYPDKIMIDKQDENIEVTLYEANILNTNVTIAIGKEKYTFVDKNVIYFPIYLVKNGTVYSQIGVYETLTTSMPNLIDIDGDIDINKLSVPLLYTTTTLSMIESAKIEDESDELVNEVKLENIGKGVERNYVDNYSENEDESNENESDEEDSDEDESDEDESDEANKKKQTNTNFEEIFSSISYLKKPLLENETSSDAKNIEKEFRDDKQKPWIKRFMQNNYYNIIPGKENADCLFDIIKDAYSQIGYNTTVQLLRTKLSQELTREIFESYKTIYETYKDNLKDDSENLKRLLKKHNILKKRLKETESHSTQIDIINDAKIIEKQFKEAKAELNLSKDMLEKYKMMEHINSLNDFKSYIQTCNFWANTWALSTLEKLLNVKIIILDHNCYVKKNYHHVLVCNSIVDINLKYNHLFNPEHYIIVEKDEDKYRLITYRERGIFKFKELPYTLKEMIVTKCMEQPSTIYNHIEDFIDLKNKLGFTNNFNDLTIFQDGGMDFENNIVFLILDSDNMKTNPGQFYNEEIPIEMIHDYATLNNYPDWRQKLSNNYMSPMRINGKTWPSVTHYYEGSKFAKQNPEFSYLFTLDSKSDISKDPLLARAIGAGLKTYHGKDINTQDIKVDSDFYKSNNKGRSKKELEKALNEKIKQCNDFKDILKKTKTAKLILFRHGNTPIVQDTLMKLRKNI